MIKRKAQNWMLIIKSLAVLGTWNSFTFVQIVNMVQVQIVCLVADWRGSISFLKNILKMPKSWSTIRRRAQNIWETDDRTQISTTFGHFLANN